MGGCLVFHKWKYLDKDHRICEKCGNCEYYDHSLSEYHGGWTNVVQGYHEDDYDRPDPLDELLKHKAQQDATKDLKDEAKRKRDKAKEYARRLE